MFLWTHAYPIEQIGISLGSYSSLDCSDGYWDADSASDACLDTQEAECFPEDHERLWDGSYDDPDHVVAVTIQR